MQNVNDDAAKNFNIVGINLHILHIYLVYFNNSNKIIFGSVFSKIFRSLSFFP